MQNVTTDRRRALKQIVGSAAVITVAGAAAPALAAVPADAIDRSAWDNAMGAFEAARCTHESVAARWERTDAAYARICEKAAQRIEWKKLSGVFLQSERERIMERGDLDELYAQFVDAEGKTWWHNRPEVRKEAFSEALDQVRHYRRVRDEADRRLGYSQISDRCDETSEALASAQSVLIGLPSPDLPALLWKLEYVIDDCNGSISPWATSYVAPVLADARRLLSGEV